MDTFSSCFHFPCSSAHSVPCLTNGVVSYLDDILGLPHFLCLSLLLYSWWLSFLLSTRLLVPGAPAVPRWKGFVGLNRVFGSLPCPKQLGAPGFWHWFPAPPPPRQNTSKAAPLLSAAERTLHSLEWELCGRWWQHVPIWLFSRISFVVSCKDFPMVLRPQSRKTRHQIAHPS